MNMHKRIRLTPYDRQKIWQLYQTGEYKVSRLAELYRVSRPTIYKILARARKREFIPRKSTNERYRSLKYGLKRLAKVERALEEKRKKESRRYNKSYPGELLHLDTKRLPLLKGEEKTYLREYLFVAIDDFSRELYAGIFPDKTQHSAALFMKQIAEECPYTIEYTFSDNGKEFKGAPGHAFMKACAEFGIGQKFTRPNRPQANGKAERVIRTLMDMWHKKEQFIGRKQRQISLLRFINFYNTVKPHKGIDNMTPYEKLIDYFYCKSGM
ncbi:MAG: IS481 family transposase [Deltaproteobacteria bacterium]|nr:MAG: IS481 family transposase [Deltaproteobacteria bacterium]